VRLERRLKCFDLCCGAGALSHGFARAGGVILGGIDSDEQVLRTARANHPHARWESVRVEDFAQAIRKERDHPAWKANTLLAGLPCQGFSRAGNRNPNDARNYLYRHLLEVAALVRPLYVVVENVPWMACDYNSAAYSGLCTGLERLGYAVGTRVLDAADYGAPQFRRRVFILGSRDGNPEQIFEFLRPSGHRVTVRDAFRGLSPTVEDASQSHAFMKHGPAVVAKLRTLQPGGPISYRRLEWDVAAPTLIAGHRALPVHPKQPRAISVREAARLQGFADNYVFEGSISSQIEQVANAVPPPLAAAVARAIQEMPRHTKSVFGFVYKKLQKSSSRSTSGRLRKAFEQTHRLSQRKFPWRRVRNPFVVLVTEILLQRTNGELARTVWRPVVQLVPTPEAAAAVDLRTLGSHTRRIGIRSRARTIKRLGAAIVEKHRGRLPKNFEELMRLPGVGLYIAAAVRLVSHGIADFPIDANAFRFVSRYFGVKLHGRKSEARQLREFMSTMMPTTDPRPYFYGFLDFCATTCRPLKPACGTCPLMRTCKRYGVNAEAPPTSQ